MTHDDLPARPRVCRLALLWRAFSLRKIDFSSIPAGMV